MSTTSPDSPISSDTPSATEGVSEGASEKRGCFARAKSALRLPAYALAVLFLVAHVTFLGSPFERDASSLMDWLPGDVEAAVRGEGISLLDRPLAKELGYGSRQMTELLRTATDGINIEGEFLARHVLDREIVAAMRNEELLVLTRISRLAKAIDRIGWLGSKRLEQAGVEITPYGFTIDQDDGLTWHVYRERDVLALSTDEDLLLESRALAQGGGGTSLLEAAPSAAFLTDRYDSDERVTGWCSGSFLDDWLHELLDVDLALDLLDLLNVKNIRGLQVTVDPQKRTAALDVTVVRSSPSNSFPLTGAAAEGAVRAQLFSEQVVQPPAGRFITAGLSLPTQQVVQAALAYLPQRERADGAAFARLLSSELRDELSCVLTRRPDGRSDLLLAIRGRRPGSAAALEARMGDLLRQLDVPQSRVPRSPDGVYLLEAEAWQAESAWLRPGLAFHGEFVLLTSNVEAIHRIFREPFPTEVKAKEPRGGPSMVVGTYETESGVPVQIVLREAVPESN